MRSLLKATAMLGSVSLVNMATGLVSAKVSALLLGPAGVGQIALLQSLLTMTGMMAALGISTGLIRSGAHALGEKEMARFTALKSSAAIMLTISGVAIAALMIGFQRPLAQLALGSTTRTNGIAIMAVSTGFVLAAGYHNGVLNAHHRVADLAKAGFATAVLGPAISIACIAVFRENGIPWAILGTTIVGFAAAAIVRYRAIEREPSKPSLAARVAAASDLLRFGPLFTLSMLLGAGVLYTMPIIVLNRLSKADVGYYRAASTLAVTYLGFLLTTLQQDYNPRVSAVQHDPVALQRLINEQLRVILLIGSPLIFAMIAFSPIVVTILFSSRFSPAVPILEWQLIGDVFKFASWTMSFVILARLGSRSFFMTETFGGGMLLASSWFFMDRLGLEGIGIAFTVTSASYCLLCWLVLRWNFKLAWSRDNTALFAAVVMGLALVSGAAIIAPPWVRSAVALCLAFVATAYSARAFEAELSILPRLRARLRLIKASRNLN